MAPRKGDWVWRLKKGLYRLVQASRTWNEELNSHVVSEALAATPNDPAVYVKTGKASSPDDSGWTISFGVGPPKELEALAKGVVAG